MKVVIGSDKDKYVVCDKFKLNKNDFYNFYKLSDIDRLITNHDVAKKIS